MTGFHSIEELIEDLRNGQMVILVDDEDRENEGDLVLAADHVTPKAINFMAVEARGLICLTLSAQQTDRLQLPQMVRDDMNFAPNKTAFTVSIEASSGVSTGISAADRAHTIRIASNPLAKPSDVHMPGHIFPIRAQQGGVLKRAGHTEGSVDLARLAGLNPAAVICEVMNADGSMARVTDLRIFAKTHGLKIGTIVDLIQYRLKHETLVEEVHSQPLPGRFGEDAQLRVFRSKVDGIEHLVLQKGQISKEKPVLAHVHLDHFTRDLVQALSSGRNPVLDAWNMIDQAGSGLFLLLRGNNRSVVASEIKALLEAEEDTAKAVLMDGQSFHAGERDPLDDGIGAQILRACGAHQIRLLSSKPDRRVGLKAFDLEIVEVVPLQSFTTHGTEKSHETLQNRSGHKPLQ